MLLDTHQIPFEFTVAQKCAKIGKVTVVCQCHQKLFSKLKRAWKLVVNLKRRAKVFGLGTTESKSNLTFRRSSKEATKGSQFSLLDFFSGFKERLSQGTIFPLSRRSLLQKNCVDRYHPFVNLIHFFVGLHNTLIKSYTAIKVNMKHSNTLLSDARCRASSSR